MNKILVLTLATVILAACSEEAPPAPTPELGSFGVDLTAIDNKVRPQDDFFRHVNGAWLSSFTIPEDRSNYGSFTVLSERSEQRVRAIIEEATAAGEDATLEQQKIGDFYASFMDEARVNELGVTPLAPHIAEIEAISSKQELAALLAKNSRMDTGTPVNFYINQDVKAPDSYTVYFTQTGLGLPDRDYYLDPSARFKDIREKYLAYIEDILSLANIPGAADKAIAVMELETAMAQGFWTRAESRDRDKTYNPYSRADLKNTFPRFAWENFLEGVGLGTQENFIIRQPSSLEHVVELIEQQPLETWKAYLTFHLIDETAPYLNQPLVERQFAFRGTALSGTPQLKDRWKRGVDVIDDMMGEAVGKIYVERHFPAQSKEAMDELVANLVAAYRERITKLDWMTAETKTQALDKLEKFRPKIGYPEKWRDYSALEISADDLLGNVMRANNFAHNRNIAKLGGPIDRTEWFMTPQTVNAYYSPTGNEIVFPAAILQPPFFDPHADLAVNYGGIGAVIGHEIGHGFDDQGRKSDGDGMLRDWWQPADAEAFQAKASKLGKQYALYSPLPGMTINPELTMGENIGDLGGVTVAYHAYKLALGGEEAPVIDGYTGDQRFFMAYAQIWRRLYREDELRRRLVTDSHSPSEFRTNGVLRNIDAWYDAFNVQESDILYLAPEERVRIW